MAPSATNEEDTVTRPIYPDRPSQLPSFTVQLGEWLPHEDTNYASLLKQHTVMYRDRTCAVPDVAKKTRNKKMYRLIARSCRDLLQ